MLHVRRRVSTANVNVDLSVSHGLGASADVIIISPIAPGAIGGGANGACGRTYLLPAWGAARCCVHNSIQSQLTMDVFAWLFQGRLY
jgi:hypothetical protein